MKEIYRANDPAQAHLLCGMLRSEGIDAVVSNDLLFGARGEAPLDLSTLPAISIPDEADGHRALELIEEYLGAERARNAGETWECPDCEEAVEGQFSECWKCGAERPSAQA